MDPPVLCVLANAKFCIGLQSLRGKVVVEVISVGLFLVLTENKTKEHINFGSTMNYLVQ